MVIKLVILVWLGLAAGSFVSAIVWRLRQEEKRKRKGDKDLSILKGRSVCPHCRHVLKWYDLVPVFSWLWLKGNCRYCSRPISWQYPVLELGMAAVFVASYILWPGGVYGAGEWTLFVTWLLAAVGLTALLIYDLRWMLLPSKIIYPTLAVAVAGRGLYIAAYEPQPARTLALWLLSVAVASGFFYLIFMVSSGKWIGYGDVRLGWITGTLLAHPTKSLLMIFLASVIGSIVALPDLIRGRKTFASHIPFGPFLIMATALALLFGDTMIAWYKEFVEL